MTDQELELRLRNWYRAESGEADRAPAALRAAVAAIPVQARRVGRLPWADSMSRLSFRLAAAAVIAVLAVGGAFYVTRPSQPAVGGPSTTPGLSPNPSPATSPSSSVVPAGVPSWSLTGSMSVVGGRTATRLVDGRVLVASGGPKDDAAELYDPVTGTWTRTGSMITGRYDFTATLLPDGKVLVAGGNALGSKYLVLASAELYDPGTGTWTTTGSMTTPRFGQTATPLPDGEVLVVGGWGVGGNHGTPAVATAELYDPRSGTWTGTGSMTTPRAGGAATLLRNGTVLVAGGTNRSGDPLASAELYDPATGTWSSTGSMRTTRIGHTVTPLPDGKVLVAGGSVGGGLFGGPPLASAELYDPRTGAWTATGTMTTPRASQTATLLLDGRVLVVGGGVDVNTALTAELYNPGMGAWTATVSMVKGPGAYAATLLPDGKVLVMNGADPNDTAGVTPDAFELYDPGSP
jgi:hypothetical protein